MAIRLPNATRTAMVDAWVDRMDLGAGAGTIDIRTGGQPASAEDAASGTLLATLTCADPAFGAGANGVATVSGTPSGTGAAAGTAGWFRCKDSTGATVCDGAVGSELTLNTTSISVGVTVTVTGGTFTQPAG